MKSDSQLCTLPPLLFFYPTFLCEQMGGGIWLWWKPKWEKRQTHTYSTYTPAVTHGYTHTQTFFTKQIQYFASLVVLPYYHIFIWYDMITLYLCVFFIVVMDHSGQTGSTISLLQWRHCTHTVQKVSIETQWWQCFFFLDRETDTVREGGEGEAPGRLWIRWMVERKR